jgi:hypothetical protein
MSGQRPSVMGDGDEVTGGIGQWIGACWRVRTTCADGGNGEIRRAQVNALEKLAQGAGGERVGPRVEDLRRRETPPVHCAYPRVATTVASLGNACQGRMYRLLETRASGTRNVRVEGRY